MRCIYPGLQSSPNNTSFQYHFFWNSTLSFRQCIPAISHSSQELRRGVEFTNYVQYVHVTVVTLETKHTTLETKEHWGREGCDVSTQASKAPPITPLSNITFFGIQRYLFASTYQLYLIAHRNFDEVLNSQIMYSMYMSRL